VRACAPPRITGKSGTRAALICCRYNENGVPSQRSIASPVYAGVAVSVSTAWRGGAWHRATISSSYRAAAAQTPSPQR